MAYIISEHIKKGSFSNIYLLYGKEDYLKSQFRDKLIKALLPNDNGMNLSRFYNNSGKKSESDSMTGEIVSLCSTLPFFSDKRVIVTENMGFFKNSFDELLDLLPAIPDTTYLIMTESEVDERKKLFKSVVKLGVAEKYDKPDENTISRWVSARVSDEGKKISPKALREFINRTCINMINMDRELLKLLSYCRDKDTIDVADIDAICTVSLEEQVFNIVNAIAVRDKSRALYEYTLLYKLLVPPREIMYRLSASFIQIMDTKTALVAGHSESEIASLTKSNPYAVKKRAESARLYEKKSLAQCIALSSETLRKMNTGLIDDRTGVEMYILQCLSA